MPIKDDKNLAGFVPDRLPQFVRVDHPTLVAFLSAYYEWLDLRRNEGVIVSPMALSDVSDIDKTMDQFVETFKNQYLFSFPDTLAFNEETGMPVDRNLLMKNIKQFYRAKGTEKSYEFLFRIFYDTAVEFYYPKTDILRLSSGRWVQNNFLRVSNTLGDDIYKAAGNTIVQRDAKGRVLASAKVIDVTVYQKSNFDVADLLITARNGTFRPGTFGFEFFDGDKKYKEVKIYSVVSSVEIINGGSGYQIGDRLVFTTFSGDSGQRASGSVIEVDYTGSVRRLSIDDFGINYDKTPSISIASSTGTGFVGSVTVGSLCQAAGYYSNNDGRLSTNKVLQDNQYYQNWSYVLKSEIVIDRYRELIRKLVHPAGTAMFGQVQIKRCLKEDIDNSVALFKFEVPYIGNYTPYTFYTFDNLEDWFIHNGATAGYNPEEHDDEIQFVGRYPSGNPISNRMEYSPTGDVSPDIYFDSQCRISTPCIPVWATNHDPYTDPLNGDPFWFIYRHPNRKLYGDHIIKVWENQVEDFITWREWVLPRFGNLRGSYSTAVDDWINEARSLTSQYESTNCCFGKDGEISVSTMSETVGALGYGKIRWRDFKAFKYATVNYDTTSDFRKIRTGSFFEMPLGQAFNCRTEDLNVPPLPSIVVDNPLPGQVVRYSSVSTEMELSEIPLEQRNTIRNLVIQYSVQGAEDAPFFGIKKVKFVLDSSQILYGNISGTNSIIFRGIRDGRHLLVVELVDEINRPIANTRKNIPFFYELLILPEVTDPPEDNQRGTMITLSIVSKEKDTREPIKTIATFDYSADKPVLSIDFDAAEFEVGGVATPPTVESLSIVEPPLDSKRPKPTLDSEVNQNKIS